MKTISLVQRSPEWLLWREQGIGSSDAPCIVLGKHFQTTVSALLKRKIKALREAHVATDAPNAAMNRGVKFENAALDQYRNWTGFDAQPLCVEHEEFSWLRASLDGLVCLPSRQIVVEAKVPSNFPGGLEQHRGVLKGEIPEKYRIQMDHQLLATGLSEAHYVSYQPDFPRADRLRVLPYRPQPSRLTELLLKEKDFWSQVLEGVKNPPPQRGKSRKKTVDGQ